MADNDINSTQTNYTFTELKDNIKDLVTFERNTRNPCPFHRFRSRSFGKNSDGIALNYVKHYFNSLTRRLKGISK